MPFQEPHKARTMERRGIKREEKQGRRGMEKYGSDRERQQDLGVN